MVKPSTLASPAPTRWARSGTPWPWARKLCRARAVGQRTDRPRSTLWTGDVSPAGQHGAHAFLPSEPCRWATITGRLEQDHRHHREGYGPRSGVRRFQSAEMRQALLDALPMPYVLPAQPAAPQPVPHRRSTRPCADVARPVGGAPAEAPAQPAAAPAAQPAAYTARGRCPAGAPVPAPARQDLPCVACTNRQTPGFVVAAAIPLSHPAGHPQGYRAGARRLRCPWPAAPCCWAGP